MERSTVTFLFFLHCIGPAVLNAATNTIRNATQHHSYHQYDSTNTAAAVHSFNILDYGAIADGSTLNTLALVAAVNAAKAASGRAEVVVPAAAGRREGTLDHTHNHNARYLVGAFSLASNVVLRIETGATLVASTNMTDYPFDGWNWTPALVSAKDCNNTGVVGGGTIDGQAPGPYWAIGFDATKSYFIPRTWQGFGPGAGCVGECRPTLIRFVDCSNVILQGDGASAPLRVHNSPDWTLLFRRATNVHMQYLDVYGDVRWPNNDGVDFESVVGIAVLDSVFNTGDDGIVFDSGNCNQLRVPFTPQPPPATRSAVLRNLTISSHSSAIKFEQIFQQNHSAISDMIIEDIRITGSSRGIGFQQRTGAGSISNITFRNIVIETRYPTGDNWWGSGEAIWVTNVAENSNDDRNPDLAEDHDSGGLTKDIHGLTGTIRDIVFENITMRAENSILLSGLTKAIGPLTFSNIDITIGVFGNVSCTKGNTTQLPSGCRDYRPKDGTQVVYGNTPGIILEGEGTATFTNISVKFQHPRQPYFAECVRQGPGWSGTNTTWVGDGPHCTV